MADTFYSFHGDLEKFTEKLTALERKQLPYATRLASNNMAKAAQDDYRRELSRVFDRPTPFTLNSSAIWFAKKDNPEARIFIRSFAGKGRTPAQTWLQPEVEGGERRVKRFEQRLRSYGVLQPNEFVVPASAAPRDQYGNLPRGLYTKILSDLAVLGDVGGNRNKRRRGEAVYFVLRRSRDKGVFRRNGRSLVPVLIFVTKAPSYRPRLDWQGVMRKSWQTHAPRFFADALRQAIATARV